MPAVLLAGAFGQRNPGDDALLAAFARALPEWHILATARGRDSSGLPGVSIVPVDSPATIARAIAASDAVVFAGGTALKTLPRITRRRPLSLMAGSLVLA